MLAFYLAKPFLPVIITSAVIAYLSYPLYEKTQKYVRSKSWAAFIVTIFIMLVFTVPTVFVVGLAFQEAQYYTSFLEKNSDHIGTNFLKVVCRNEQWMMCKATRSALGMLPRNDPDYYIEASVEKISNFIIVNVDKLVSSALTVVFNFFIMIFLIYYFFKDGALIYGKAKELLPVKDSHKERIFNRFKEITMSVFYGNISISIIQGILGSLAFLALGIPSPFLWGMIMALFAFIPYIGTAIVWLPASLNLIFMAYIDNSDATFMKGILLLIFGLFVLSVIDHLIKPKIIGDNAKVHPILVLIGVLGGLHLFGFIGLILGPAMLALLVTFAEIYEEEKPDIKKYF